MTKTQLLEQLTALFIEIFNDPTIHLTSTTTAADIPEWDSLITIQLIVAVEKKFKVKFRAHETREWKNVGEMADSILSRLAV